MLNDGSFPNKSASKSHKPITKINFFPTIFQYSPTLPGYPWPLPQEWTAFEKEMTFNENDFEFIELHRGCLPLQMAFDRYKKLIFPHNNKDVEHPRLRVIRELRVSNLTCEEVPYLGMNETCKFPRCTFILKPHTILFRNLIKPYVMKLRSVMLDCLSYGFIIFKACLIL